MTNFPVYKRAKLYCDKHREMNCGVCAESYLVEGIRIADRRIAELEQRLAVATDLLQQIHDCPVNWVESTFPKGGMNPDNPRHRGQVVGTQHIAYTRLYNIAAFLRQNTEHEKGE